MKTGKRGFIYAKPSNPPAVWGVLRDERVLVDGGSHQSITLYITDGRGETLTFHIGGKSGGDFEKATEGLREMAEAILHILNTDNWEE